MTSANPSHPGGPPNDTGTGKWPYPEDSAGNRPAKAPPEPELDEAIAESFPASDPPAPVQPQPEDDAPETER